MALSEPWEATERPERRWVRAALLLALAFWVPVVPSLSLVTVPFVLLAVVLPRKDWKVLALAAFALIFTFTLAPPSGGLWYLERGWALLLGGWFAALTLRWPTASFTARALGSVFGAGAAAALLMVRRPGSLASVDALIQDRLAQLEALAIDATSRLASDPAFTETMTAVVETMTQVRGQFYPGLLLIASVCALGVAWWGYVRLAQGSDRGLGPLRDFRFNDQLVWIAIASVALLLWGGAEGGTRIGANALVFMSALYAVRGAAVVVFVTGGVSVVGGLLVILGMLLVAPYVLSLAVFIGVGDTWLHVRERALSAFGGGAP